MHASNFDAGLRDAVTARPARLERLGIGRSAISFTALGRPVPRNPSSPVGDETENVACPLSKLSLSLSGPWLAQPTGLIMRHEAPNPTPLAEL